MLKKLGLATVVLFATVSAAFAQKVDAGLVGKWANSGGSKLQISSKGLVTIDSVYTNASGKHHSQWSGHWLSKEKVFEVRKVGGGKPNTAIRYSVKQSGNTLILDAPGAQRKEEFHRR